jgi:anti-anti-sigma regulatory factor
MAFSLFSKPLPKSRPAEPGRGREAPAPRPATPVAPRPTVERAGFKTTQRLVLSEEWNPRHSRIEVTDSAPGLTPVLENAALLFANGQAKGAREILEQGLQTEPDTRRAVLAWLALFDLLQRLDDRQRFEQLALQFVVAFERSAPMWEERHALPDPTPPKMVVGLGRLVALVGALGEPSQVQVDALLRAAAEPAPVRLDVAGITAVDDAGARLFTTALRDLRRGRVLLQWQGLDKLRKLLDARVQAAAGGEEEGCWLLLLELLQWQGDQGAFDERAVEYAITFELSPPSWESLAVVQDELAIDPSGEGRTDDAMDLIAMTGVLTGPTDPQIARLHDFASSREQVLVDMTDVERIDFVCAGSLYNAIQQLQRRETVVHLAGASAIIRSLLLLIGIPPRHFAKRPQ